MGENRPFSACLCTICMYSAFVCACVYYLGLFYRGVVFVTHGADLHAPLPLSVTLAEELLHDTVRPLPVQLERLSGVAQVCTVHHVLENLNIRNNKVGARASHMFHDAEATTVKSSHFNETVAVCGVLSYHITESHDPQVVTATPCFQHHKFCKDAQMKFDVPLSGLFCIHENPQSQ